MSGRKLIGSIIALFIAAYFFSEAKGYDQPPLVAPLPTLRLNEAFTIPETNETVIITSIKKNDGFLDFYFDSLPTGSNYEFIPVTDQPDYRFSEVIVDVENQRLRQRCLSTCQLVETYDFLRINPDETRIFYFTLRLR